jgi:sugar/nucleoside kinase (ribokinase family)
LKDKVSSSWIVKQEHTQTDLITILTTPTATPSFIGTRAANYELAPADINEKEEEIKKSSACIVTLEVPVAVATHAVLLRI